MNEKIDRLRFDSMDQFAVSSLFISMEGAGFERKKFVSTSEVSHLERYQYALGNEKIALVYDTKAKILTVDAKSSVLDDLKKHIPQSRPPVDYKPREIVVASKPKPAAKKAVKNVRSKSKDNVHIIKAKPVPNAPIAPIADTAVKAPESQQSDKTEPKSQDQPKAESYSVKSFAKNRMDWCVKMISELPGVKHKQSASNGDIIYQITNGENKLTIVYAKNQTVTVQGKSGKLFDDILAVLAVKSDLKLLKKHLPTGIRYLSEPSRIDLSNGINDLAGNVRLSDYSVLLIAPYRALEKLIYDLQQAENINVKMIGQAYEKDDSGKYMLKRGYTKRIGSVVYSEVMSALYTEYFAIRNFYMHSDNSAESQSRGISNKADAQNILKVLLGVIEYNSKKLSEIGFNLENNQ